jgi:WD40 repeat protein
MRWRQGKISAALLSLFLLLFCLQANAQTQAPELIVQNGHTARGLTGQFALHGKLIVTVGQEHAIKFWDPASGNLLKTLTGFNASMPEVAEALLRISPDQKRAVVSDVIKGIKILNLETGLEDPVLKAPPNVKHESIHDLRFSATGRYIYCFFSFGQDEHTNYALRGWDTTDASSVTHLLNGMGLGVFALSPNGTLMLGYSSCPDKSTQTIVEVRDTATGQRLFQKAYDGCGDVKFTPDSKALVHISEGRFDLLDGRTGQLNSTLKVTGKPGRVTFSNGGQFLAAEVEIPEGKSSTTQLVIWSVSSGEIQRRFTLGSGYVNDVECAWSPDNQQVACKMQTDAFAEKGLVQVWSVQTGNKALEFGPALTRLGRFLYGPILWSPDGNYFVTFGEDGASHFWDPTNGREFRTLAGQTRATDYVAFSPDGKYFVSEKESRRDTDNLHASFSIWDLQAGSLLSNIAGQFKSFSSDSRYVITESRGQDRATIPRSVYAPFSGAYAKEDETNIWSLSSGNLVSTFPGRFLNLSADNERLITRSQAKGVVVWNTKSKAPLRTLARYLDETSFAIASDDGKYILNGNSRGQTIELIEVLSGAIKRLPGFPTQAEDPADFDVFEYSAAFSHDNKFAACRRGGVGGGETLLIWDLETGSIHRKLKAKFALVSRLAFSPDNRTLVSMGSEITRYDVGTGEEKQANFTYDGPGYDEVYIPDTTTDAFFSPNSRFFATLFIGDDIDLNIFDLQTNGNPPFLKDGNYRAAAFSADNKTLAIVKRDNSIQFWDVQSGRLLASAIDMDQDGWLTISPDGRFDGSSGAWQKILWRFSPTAFDVVPVEVFFGDFYYPGLLADAISRRSMGIVPSLAQKDRRQPQLELSLTSATTDKGITTRTVEARITVSHAPAGAQDVRLFRNGSLVKVWHGDALKGQSSVTLEATIPVVAGKNLITAYAFNRDNIKSPTSSLTVEGAESLRRVGTLYVLAIGINKYRNPDYNLNFAVADADEISRQVKNNQDQLGNYTHTELLLLSDQDATRENIELALGRLAGKSSLPLMGASPAIKEELQRIKAVEPEDAVIIYYAGHGVAIGERFYLLPFDFTAGTQQQIRTSGISDLDLNEMLEPIGAGKMLMVIDACQSGQALGGEREGRGPMNSKGMAQLAYDKGMYILTAAQSFQAAKEIGRTPTGKDIKHGLLSFTLLEGFARATADNNRQITERNWMNYAVEQVPLLQMDEMKKRHLEIERSGPGRRSTELMIVADDKESDPDKRDVQRPRVFYRRELESNPFIVAKQ